MTEVEITKLHSIFDALDQDGSGGLTKDELKKWYEGEQIHFKVTMWLHLVGMTTLRLRLAPLSMNSGSCAAPLDTSEPTKSSKNTNSKRSSSKLDVKRVQCASCNKGFWLWKNFSYALSNDIKLYGFLCAFAQMCMAFHHAKLMSDQGKWPDYLWARCFFALIATLTGIALWLQVQLKSVAQQKHIFDAIMAIDVV